MDEKTEIIVKGALCLVVIVLILLNDRRPASRAPGRAGQFLVLAALLAVVAYFNFFAFHGTGFVHHWEMFHYQLGSRYFPELGYDGLYVASLTAQKETHPELWVQPFVRDLRTNQVVPAKAVAQHAREVRSRFTPERWDRFVKDNDYFLESNSEDYLAKIRSDHGFNPTPTWTFGARLLSGWLPASSGTLFLLGLVDPILLALAFVALRKTYGSRTACLALVIFGLGYAWRFDWIGGAFLRLDWLAALVISVCLLRLKKPRTAGALLAFASFARLFPVLFLLGPAVLAVKGLWRRENPTWVWRLLQGFALSAALCVLAGSLAGRGPGAWKEFKVSIQLHHGTWLTNNVGLENLLLYGPDTMSRKLVDWSRPEPWLRWQRMMDRMQEERRVWYLGASGLLLLVVGAAMWRASPDESLVLGLGVVFALTLLTCYYWIMLIMVPIRGGRSAALAVLGLSAGLFSLHLVTPSFEMIFGLMSWGLSVLLVAWCLPAAWNLRRYFAS